MAISTATTTSIIAELGDRFIVRQPAAVSAFLDAHPYLVPLLQEAAEQIGRSFGPETPVALEVIPDREAAGQEELFALIETPLPVAEATRRLDDLDEGWWLDALDRARCNLTIDVVSRPPSSDV